MAITKRGRRERYDNIAIGSATGPERTISGETVSPVEIHGGGFMTSTSNAEVWHTNVAVGSSVSDTDAVSEPPENIVGAAADPGEENVDSTSNIST